MKQYLFLLLVTVIVFAYSSQEQNRSYTFACSLTNYVDKDLPPKIQLSSNGQSLYFFALNFNHFKNNNSYWAIKTCTIGALPTNTVITVLVPDPQKSTKVPLRDGTFQTPCVHYIQKNIALTEMVHRTQDVIHDYSHKFDTTCKVLMRIRDLY